MSHAPVPHCSSRSPAWWWLGGTATAARTLVGSGDIAPGAIKARHLANGAVTGAKIARGAVSLTRLAPGARPVVVASLPGPGVFVPVGAISSATADCGAGRRATGGGFYSSVAFPAASVPGVSSWSVIVWNDTAVDVTVNAYVVCVAP